MEYICEWRLLERCLAYLILETGQIFSGRFRGGRERAGEVVFNTSHSGYEEMATDPSYFSQILVTTATQQGNYGVNNSFWESRRLWINGFVALEIQQSSRDSSWLSRLIENEIPVLTDIDTRALTLVLRSQGTTWGSIVNCDDLAIAKDRAVKLIEEAKKLPADWTQIVCRQKIEDRKGKILKGPRIAVLDFGAKENILRELELRAQEIRIFPSNTTAEEILAWKPDGIMLSNGPGDPAKVEVGTHTVRQLLGKKFIFGICMGHQVLALALGAKTYKLKFGHRGSNHPIRDDILGKVYVTSQNHGYNVDSQSLPEGVRVTHINLNDKTVAGIGCSKFRCMSVQFHPESHPGPHDASQLFDYFMKEL
ncbi:MAG: carbamoyl phosphate synthase small subunit [Bdellovibrionales bacterium RBG_16_40_8]|nr:MAG: carbamoyl phosphate synthase small subunit [Bdellovibrionales bacterium RBG_16_40_8]